MSQSIINQLLFSYEFLLRWKRPAPYNYINRSEIDRFCISAYIWTVYISNINNLLIRDERLIGIVVLNTNYEETEF